MRRWARPGLILLVALVAAAAVAQAPDALAAVRGGDRAALQQLLANGADPNLRDDDGRSVLVVATHAGRADLVADLLDAGADTRYRDRELRSAEVFARSAGYAEILQLLQRQPTRDGFVTAQELRMRRSPDLQAPVVTSLSISQRVMILDETTQPMAIGELLAPWYRLRTLLGAVGWSYGAYLSVQPDIASPAAVVAMIAHREWTEVTRDPDNPQQWVVYRSCFSGTPTVGFMVQEGELRLHRFYGQDADLYGLNGITEEAGDLVFELWPLLSGTPLVARFSPPGPQALVGIWRFGADSASYVSDDLVADVPLVAEAGGECGEP